MAKKPTTEPVIETPAVEEIANVGDDFIQKELTKFNIADATIAQWKEQYGSLTISDPNNKEEYETLNQARTFVKKKRIEVEKVGKGLRTNAIKFQKAVLEEERRIISLIDPLETYLEGEKKRVDDIKEEEKRLKVEKEQIVLQERAVKLIQMGMQLIDGAYVMDDIKISVTAAKNYDDFTWNTLIAGVETKWCEKEALRLEEERIKEQAAAEAKRIAEENLAKQEALRKQEEELAARQRAIEEAELKAKAEAERLIKEKEEAEKRKLQEEQDRIKKAQEDLLKSRMSSLFALGFDQQGEYLHFNGNHMSISLNILQNHPQETWPTFLQEVHNKVEIRKEQIEKERIAEQERIKQEAIEAERKRVEQENEAKAKLEEENRLKAEKEEADRIAEEKRLAALAPDIDKLNNYLKAMHSVPIPEFGTPSYVQFALEIKSIKDSCLKHIYEKRPK